MRIPPAFRPFAEHIWVVIVPIAAVIVTYLLYGLFLAILR
jgi:hypothetical protein